MNLTSIKLTVKGAHAWATVTGPLTSGMVGLPVTMEYDEAWDGLTKNLVCRCSPLNCDSGERRTILNVGETAAVAHEVMQAGMYLWLGVEGYSADGKLVIPTTWARCLDPIQPGANTGTDLSADPTLPIWGQLQAQIEQIEGGGIPQEELDEIRACAQEAAGAAQRAADRADRAEAAAVRAEEAASARHVELLDVELGEAFYLVTGDEAVGRILLSTTSLSITEGESATFTVRLSAAPGEAQVVRLVTNHEDISLAPAALTFTADNYGTEQVVTVTVATDTDAVSESGFITATSSGAGFAEIAVAIVDKDADAVRTKYTYVFNVDSSAAPDKTLTLVANPNGDGVTDWGDGTVDALTTHAYADYGTYTVVTDNTLVINEGTARSASQKALTRVESWSDALYVHTDGSHDAYRLFYECINLAYCADVPRGYTALTDTFRNTRALKTSPAISGTVTDMENTFWSSGITAPPAIPTSVVELKFAFNFCTAMTTAPDLHPGVTNAASMCRNCSNLTDTREPWKISYTGNINAEGCFTNCYKLDLTTVPTTWGGTMEVN